ncbi:hypothetical protein ACO0LM_06550 [Undibacterium sp. Di26W]|uniref:hypothetical protein n=1 Tax=Undibacterium sp. Di26W TaxID=3413035 RepID=UPI003BF34DDF
MTNLADLQDLTATSLIELSVSFYTPLYLTCAFEAVEDIMLHLPGGTRICATL